MMTSRSSSLNSAGEEDAPLVPDEGSSDSPTRLGNPITEYELESQEQLQDEPKTSNFTTLMHMLKGNIGTGILAIPKAVSHAGLLVGTVGISVLAVLCIHCMHLLVNNSKVIALRVGQVSLDYAKTAEIAFTNGPRPVQSFAKYARIAINVMLTITQIGFCCVYFLFVGRSIQEVVHNITGTYVMDFKWYLVIILPLMVCSNFIRTLKSLSPASFVANVLQITGLCMIFYYIVQDLPSIHSVPAVAPIAEWPLYFGTAIYAFEGIGIILPLENSMKTPEAFGGCTGVMNTGMVIVACLFAGIGFYGYLKYGHDIKGSITFNLNIPVISEVIQIMFTVSIFLTYPLQLYVPLNVMLPSIRRYFHAERMSSRKQLAVELAVRFVFVFITFILVIAIPLLDPLISLVGALASCSLALIFPPIINMMIMWDSGISRKRFYCTLVKDVFIICIGILGSIIGTYTSIMEIVRCTYYPKLC